MRVVLIGLGVLVVLLIAAILIGPSLIPSSVYRDQIAQAVQQATGRTFKIDGDVSLSVFPTVKAKVEKASLGNMPGGSAPTMAEIGRLDVGLKLFPLLAHRAEITSFVLNDATIHLEVGKDGTANWNFPKTRQPEQAATPASSGENPLQELSLGDVRLVNGLVTYENLQTGDQKEIKNINAKIELPNLDQPLKIDGDLTYNDQALHLTAELTKPRAVMQKGSSAISFSVKGDPLSASVSGDATFGDQMTFVGDTKLDVPSVRKLGAWLGSPIAGDRGFGPMSISGKMNYTGDAFSFDNADLKFDAIHATGNFKTTLGAQTPLVTASLATDNLDLRPYISQSNAATGGASASPAPAASAGWSTDPIDASALKSFDADLNFSAGKILVRDLTIDKSALELAVKSGVLTANLKQLALYGGAGKGTITLDGNSPALKLGANLALSGVDAQRFLKDFMKTDRIAGTGSFNVNVNGSGASQRDIVSSLNGSAAVNFANGALKGIDLVKIASIANAFLGKKGADTSQATTQSDQAQGVGDSTKFVSMGGTFAIASGVATTNDFKLINDLLSLSATGSINLPQQSIDFKVAPGKSQSDGGLKVGLLVKGPLAKPKFTPDLSGLVQSEVNKALGKLLGGGKQSDGSGNTGTTKPGNTQQLLQGLFGGKNKQQ